MDTQCFYSFKTRISINLFLKNLLTFLVNINIDLSQ